MNPDPSAQIVTILVAAVMSLLAVALQQVQTDPKKTVTHLLNNAKANGNTNSPTGRPEVVQRIVKLEAGLTSYEKERGDVQMINQRLLLIETRIDNDRQQFGRSLADMQIKINAIETNVQKIGDVFVALEKINARLDQLSKVA